MSVSSASVVQHARRASLQDVTRTALTAVGTLGMLLASTRTSAAQMSASQTSAQQARTWELRVTSGALVPTGHQRHILKDALTTAAQLSWVVRPSLAITGTFAWARSRDLASVATLKLDVFTSDVGVEARPAQWFAGRAVTFSPFAGLGAGARSYNYRRLDVDATHNLAAYGAVGGALGMGRVGVRVEVRDYATGFRPLVGAGKSEPRNDVVVMAALSLKRRGASRD
jgi:hypothetical protein